MGKYGYEEYINCKNWTGQEDDIIRKNFYTKSSRELMEFLPGRGRNDIYTRCVQLGLKGAPMYKYTDEDIKFIEDNYKNMTDAELGAVLHRAAQSIKECRRKHGIYRKDPNEDTHYACFDRYVFRNNTTWRHRSAKACDNKCFITGEPFEEIHHLQARSLIIRDAVEKLDGFTMETDINKCSQEDKRKFLNAFYDEQNKYPLGICLTKDIHKQFHNKYGYGYNTPKQFVEFVRDFYPEKLDELLRRI